MPRCVPMTMQLWVWRSLAAHVMLVSVSTEDWLLFALSKQKERTFCFLILVPKRSKLQQAAAGRSVVVKDNLYFYVVLYITQQRLYWKSPERSCLWWEGIFEQKYHALGDLGLCHRVVEHRQHWNCEYWCCRICSCSLTFSPNANLYLHISAIIY